MFGLRQKVGGHMLRVAAAVVDHQNLARSGDHVDVDLTEDLLLGRGHIDVAGAGNLVDPWHAFGTKGQRRNRLGSAHLENPINPGQASCRQHMGVDFSTGHGHHHDNLANAGNLGRQGVHQHR